MEILSKNFDNNKLQELKCSLFTGIAKILIIQPFDFLRYRIQSSEYPVSIKNITYSLINKEGFKAFLMGCPATSCGVLLSSLIQFTLYQKFQKILILREFDQDISNSLNNLEIFKLMELNHLKNFQYNYKFDVDHIDFSNEDQDFIIKTDFINNMRRSGKLDQLKFERFNIGDKLIIKPENIESIEYTAKCYKAHLTKILKICALSGCLSGIGLSIITTPIDNIRIKMQSVQNIEILEKAKYRNSNTLACIINTYNTFGIRGFFQAFSIGLLREGIASTVYFSTYEYLKNKEKIKHKTNKIKFYKSFLFGAIAGGMNWLLTFPIDTVKTKVISDSVITEKKQYKNSRDCIIINYKKNGLKSFYSGFSLVFLRGLIVNGVVLSSFDYCRAKFISNN